MVILKNFTIEKFRSCRKTELKDIGNFSVLSGKNNIGKSNCLRAMSLFFTGEVEPGIPLNIAKDCNVGKNKKKEIILTAEFDISRQIKNNSRLKSTESLLTQKPRISKIFSIALGSPTGYEVKYVVNGVSFDNTQSKIVDLFLSLFNFRYITADRSAKKAFELNLEELKSELTYRLNKKNSKASKKAQITGAITELQSLQDLSEGLFEPITEQLSIADKIIKKVSISTPKELTELISAAKYQITTQNDLLLEETLQGSGIQSLLMFNLLLLIDRNYHRKFGWKIGTIWAVEEPEVFMHHDLEEQLSNFFKLNTKSSEERFQLITTTHSTIVPQYADEHYLIQLDSTTPTETSTIAVKYDLYEFFKVLQEEKVINIIHLLTLYYDKKILLVEGHYDEEILKKLLHEAKIDDVEVFAIERFLKNPEAKGESFLKKFLEGNIEFLKYRKTNCGVIALFDWEVEIKELKYLTKNVKAPNVIYHMNEKDANPLLDPTLRGIERFYNTEIIEELNKKQKGLNVTLIHERSENKTKDRFFAETGNKYKQVKNELFLIAKAKVKNTYFKSLIETIKSA